MATIIRGGRGSSALTLALGGSDTSVTCNRISNSWRRGFRTRQNGDFNEGGSGGSPGEKHDELPKEGETVFIW